MSKAVVVIMLLSILIVYTIGSILYKVYFTRYEYQNKYINLFLIFNMIFSSPFAVLIAAPLSGFHKFENYQRAFSVHLLDEYSIFIMIIIFISIIKYSLWYMYFKKENNNLLRFSKKFVFQIPFIFLIFYPWWNMHDSAYAYVYASLILGEISILSSIVIRRFQGIIVEKIFYRNK